MHQPHLVALVTLGIVQTVVLGMIETEVYLGRREPRPAPCPVLEGEPPEPAPPATRTLSALGRPPSELAEETCREQGLEPHRIAKQDGGFWIDCYEEKVLAWSLEVTD